jgi:multidrug efflux pump
VISRVFIDRPVFAWVIALVIMLSGLGAILTLPIEQYPDIAPPTINVRTSYPGASAEALEASVTQIIEQQLTGIDGMIYFSSASDSAGRVRMTVTFERGTVYRRACRACPSRFVSKGCPSQSRARTS